jgi:uncharacterized protein YqeY
MGIQAKIAGDLFLARKNKLPTKDDLSFLLGEVMVPGKNKGNRESTDGECVQVIRNLLKNEYLKETERALYESYLPKQMSDDEVINEIKKLISEKSLPAVPKSLGEINTYFKQNFDGLYNPKSLSELSKQVLGI